MKNKISIIIALILVFIIGACTTSASATQEYAIDWDCNDNSIYDSSVVTDNETGVQYIVLRTNTYGHPNSIAITPRLNLDGTLYGSK